jgi:glutathione peroxidase
VKTLKCSSSKAVAPYNRSSSKAVAPHNSAAHISLRDLIMLNFKSSVLAILLGAFTMSDANAACAALLDHSFRPLAGKSAVKLCDAHKNQVLLVVNTASKCGFTRQYEGLEKLQKTYGKQGFSVVGFPSNEFGGQEPGTESEIKEFCTLTYGVEFPMYEKTSVKGEGASAFYKQLAKISGEEPRWNFHKYLIGRDGKLIKAFASNVEPADKALVDQVETALLVK